MIAFTGLVVSAALLVVRFAARQYSPRFMVWFRRDQLVKHAIGSFLAPPLFALVALREIEGRSGCVSVAAARGRSRTRTAPDGLAGRGSTRADAQARRWRRLLVRLGPPPCRSDPGRRDRRARSRARRVHRSSPGTAASARRGPRRRGNARTRRTGFRRSHDRAGSGVAIRVIVDTAIRAPSPAINDPTTAVHALDALEVMVRDLAARALEASVARDEQGVVRVVSRTAGLRDPLELAFGEIRSYGSGSVQVCRRMRALLEDLRGATPRGAARRDR